MPFVTEELWQRLPRAPAQESTEASTLSLMVASYPEPVPTWADPQLNEQMKFLGSVVKGVGQLRTDYKLASSKRPQLSITCSDSARAELIAARNLELTTLALASSLEVRMLMQQVAIVTHVAPASGWKLADVDMLQKHGCEGPHDCSNMVAS